MPLSGSTVTAVLYLRVSTQDQGRRGYSLPEQRSECQARAQELAAKAGAELRTYEFTDQVGGDWLERPALDQVREFLRGNRVDYFVCLDPDRFSRSLTNQLLIDEEVRKAGAAPVYVNGEYANTPEGQLFFAIRGAISQFEKAKIIERTSRGKRGAIKAGRIPQAFMVYGYTYLKDHRDGAPLAIDEDQARWVRQMYRWSATEGLTCEEIARRLTDLGVATPRGRRREWGRSTVHDILRNECYAGRAWLNRIDAKGITAMRQFPEEYRHQKGMRLTFRVRPREEWVSVPVPAIIDRETWAMAQGVLENHKKVRSGAEERPLSGLGQCSLCGAALHYHTIQAAGKPPRRIIRCRNTFPAHIRQQSQRCPLPAKSERLVLAAIWSRVRGWIEDPTALRQAAQEAAKPMPREDDGQADLQAELEALQAQERDKRGEQERVGLLFARGLWPEDRATEALEAIRAELAAIDARIRQLETRLQRLRPQAIDVDNLVTTAEQLRREVGDELDRLEPWQLREIVTRLVDHYVLHPSPQGAPAQVRLAFAL